MVRVSKVGYGLQTFLLKKADTIHFSNGKKGTLQTFLIEIVNTTGLWWKLLINICK